MAEKVTLPSISNFINHAPVAKQEAPETKEKKGRGKAKPNTVYFTPLEDIALFKTLLIYFGPKPIDKIPWAFWDLYRKFTGSDRSDSSLYHHWNGSIMKKYGPLIREGRIMDCIKFTEASLDLPQKNSYPTSAPVSAYQSPAPNLVPAPLSPYPNMDYNYVPVPPVYPAPVMVPTYNPPLYF